MKPIPKDGTEGTVLGIYGIYAKKSDFTGGSEDWAQYQISVSRIEDLGFPARVAAFRGVDQGQYARLVADASREERRRRLRG